MDLPFSRPGSRTRLRPVDRETLCFNFGFWGAGGGRSVHPPGHFNRPIERELGQLGFIKSPPSDSFCEPDEFWSIFDRPADDRLRAKHDPKGRHSDPYRKCMLRE